MSFFTSNFNYVPMFPKFISYNEDALAIQSFWKTFSLQLIIIFAELFALCNLQKLSLMLLVWIVCRSNLNTNFIASVFIASSTTFILLLPGCHKCSAEYGVELGTLYNSLFFVGTVQKHWIPLNILKSSVLFS